jgi:cobalt/nickel transport system permease protein
VGAGHAQALHLHGHSPLHRLPPECKLAAAFLFVLLVVLTPREQLWAFGAYAVVVLALAALGRVPLRFLARRLVIELPFVAFALLIPFVAHGDRVPVLWFSLSESGLHSAFNVLAKATLGASTTIVLAATTPMRDLLTGLERLRMPRGFVAIATFMLRYSDVIVGELQRMRVARVSRGYDPRTLLQARALGASFGALFIRAYERGERVHLAMVSRGWTGALPDLGAPPAGAAAWSTAAVLPVVGAVVCAAAWTMSR